MIRFFSKRKKNLIPPKYGWFGNYSTWGDAVAATSGYDRPAILEKTKTSLALVRDDIAIYERDSVLFSKKEYPYAVISSLLYIASNSGNTLRVLDFGGSLGTTYYQVRDFLGGLDALSWHVVEQPSYVAVGRSEFEGYNLKFHYSIEDSLAVVRPDVILLSSVLQYLEKPHEFLSYLVELGIPYILFDRTAFVHDGGDRLTVQYVPPEIYDASYPSWFFNEERFLTHFEGYKLKTDFGSYVVGEQDLYIDGVIAGNDKGFLFERI